MNRVLTFYLSEILDKKIFDVNEIEIGTLDDILVSTEDSNYKIIGFKVKGRYYKKLYIKNENCDFVNRNGKYTVLVDRLVKLDNPDEYVGLKFNLQDKQVVDISGKKVVRINDVKIGFINGIYKIAAVDIGFSGLLRRLGIEKFIRNMYPKLEDNLIAWDNIEALQRGNPSVKLVLPYKKLSKLHPADLADIIEELDTAERKLVMESLSPKLASDILEEVNEDVQINILENIDNDTAAELLADMPADEAADIIEELYDEHAEGILNSMDLEDAEEIREILEYEEDTVGSIMTTEFVSFSKNITTGEVIEEFRISAPPEDTIYYLYIVDESSRLVGVLSLRELIISKPDTRIEEIMHTNVYYAKDTDNVDDMIELVNKYYLMALPVVDEETKLIGVAVITDIVDEILLPKWKRKLA
jgi:CBS domain-containing protein/sporulation protein YlmC with PRC-barrel domain